MSLLSVSRNKIFWTKDFFNKSVIRKNIDDIAGIIENYSTIESKTRREQKLTDLRTGQDNICPFCHELEFDLIGMRLHFERGHCEEYNAAIERSRK